MTTLIIWAAIILGIGGFLLWLYMAGRSAGSTSERASVATKTVDVLKAQDKAGAEGPHTESDVVDRLRKGGF